MESPFRQPEAPIPEPEARAPVIRRTPHYRYEQPARRGPAIVFAVSCAITGALILGFTYQLTTTRLLPSAWYLRAGLLAGAVAWASWAVLRDRFALELQPERGRLLVLRCPALPVGSWTLRDSLHLSEVSSVDLRGRSGRQRLAVLVVGEGPLETSVRLGWVPDDQHLAAIAHWIDQARVIVAKHTRP
jgi:hypothetical protein